MVALTTLTTLKAELGITDSSSDTRLTAVIGQVSAAIETFCDRHFTRRTLTDVFRVPDRTLYLSAWPVTTVTSIIDGTTTLTTDDYVIDLAEGIIAPPYPGAGYGVGYGSPCGFWGRGYWRDVSVAYTGGYLLPGDVSANLPADIERAALDMAARYYHGGGRDPALRSETVPGVIEQSWTVVDSVQTVGGIPPDVARSLMPYRRAIL